MAKNEPNKPEDIKTEPAEQQSTPPDNGNKDIRFPDDDVVVSFDKINEIISNKKEATTQEAEQALQPKNEQQSSEKKTGRGRPPKADKSEKEPKPQKSAKDEKQAKSPKTAKQKQGADIGTSGGSVGSAKTVEPPKQETPPPPVQPPEPREAPRTGEKEQIVYINLSELHPFKDHPFEVRKDDEMTAMVESVKDKDVLYYHKRQAFLPGEIDHGALEIGYETAMRWTKGKHAFFVVSHADRPYPHVHIYYNSTTLDCTHKFRDFLGSARAFRRLSDRVCIEHSLSYIANPKPKSKSKFKHYGEWRGDKPPTAQERIKAQIDICLADKPPDMETFFQAMEAAGFEVKHRRGGGISFRAPGQERFTQLRSSTLGEGYGLEDIQAVIEGRAEPTARHTGPTCKLNLIVDIQAKMRAGKDQPMRSGLRFIT